MKAGAATALLITVLLASMLPAHGQIVREDAIWARKTTDPIVLDGMLNEPAWAQAESVTVRYGVDAGIPGSGWKVEAGLFVPTDSLEATLKFLVNDQNQLYFACTVKDSSVGGSQNFNRFDGLLMALKDHSDTLAPKPPAEHFYAWWYPDSLTPDPQPPGQPPAFIGKWANWPPGSPRTPEQIANWDAVTVVNGQSNNDAVVDGGYTVEMRFNLTVSGYDVTAPEGEIVEWNISLYDTDWFWPFDGLKFVSNRVWWQCPWGNDIWYNEVRIHARPDVTTSSGPLPDIGPEMVIAQIAGTPVIDGALTDPVWSHPDVETFDIRWDDDALRQTYPAVGPYRAGQYQPEVNGGLAPILDPADATVKMFHNDDILYLGFDVRDGVVQFHPAVDRWDGVRTTINEYLLRDNDHQLLGRRISFQVNADGTALAQDYLTTLIVDGKASVAVNLNPGTTVDTLGTQVDNGYTAELAIDLTGLGYPAGLGDHRLFLGLNLQDGDSFLPQTRSYGTYTWWFREYESTCCPVWAYLAPYPTGVDDFAGSGLDEGILARSLPNPSANPRIQFSLPAATRTTLEIFDVAGRLVERRPLGVRGPGTHEIPFDGAQRSAGMYLYRLRLEDPSGGSERVSGYGKLILLK